MTLRYRGPLIAGLVVLSGVLASPALADDPSGLSAAVLSKSCHLQVAKTDSFAIEGFFTEAGAEKSARVACVERHPDAGHPMLLLGLATELMAEGHMQQATFWYYVWQIRKSPWTATVPDEAILAGAITSSLGPAFNEWAGSDPAAMRQLMQRASSFERKAPIYSGRPPGVSAADWKAKIVKGRDEHSESVLDKAMPNTPQAIEAMNKTRAANGLYVGPWKDAGPALPADWR